MFTIYHLSDLHLGTELIQTSKSIINGFSAHNERIWVAIRDHILGRIDNNKNEYIVVITGDLSQIGSIESFKLAQTLILKNDNSEISKKYGLQLDEKKLLIVPGNHDSYDKSYFFKNNLRTFNNIFFPTSDSEDIYPILKKIQVDGSSYIFMGIDSTYKKSAASLRKKFGKGIVTNSQLDQLTGRLKEIGNNNFKIVCLHHCPIIVDCKRDRSLMLEKSQSLLSWICKNEINVVLCGHLHDDFYDVLPLRQLIKLLPKNGFRRIKMKLFKETYLNDYSPISIYGKKARYLDSIAYHYIKQSNLGLLDYEKNEFDSIHKFNDYLHNRPEYKEFIKEFSSFDKKETGIMMAGTACQENSNNNSYLEINIDNENCKMQILRHKYNKESKSLISKTTEFKLNKV